MPKHIRRLLILIAVVVVLAVSAKKFFTADSFYQYGHYRGAAVAEIASKTPKLQGSARCETCHQEVYAEWNAGIHRRSTKDNKVQGVVVKFGPGCEVCHTGPAGNHPSKEAMPLSIEDRITTITHWDRKTHPANIPARNLMMEAKDMRSLCLNCHEKLEARPSEQKQVVADLHSGTELCTNCHNPHSPKINFAALPRPPVDALTGKALAVSAVAAEGDVRAGKTVAVACAGCHGEVGKSVNPAWPNLAGQHPAYLRNALQAFKSGARQNDMMSGIAAGLSDADINNVTTYFAKNRCGVTGGDAAQAVLGKAKAAASGCASCHSSGGLRNPGVDGIGASPVWPNLAGQNAEYLAGALHAFKDGSRKHPIMLSVASSLSDAEITNLAAYYASANCQ